MVRYRALTAWGLLTALVLHWGTSNAGGADALPWQVAAKRERGSDVRGAIQQVSPHRGGTPQASVAGGGQQTTALIGLIQGTVAPETWLPAPNVAATAALGGGSPAALQLVNVIQENIQPPTWDVNGGLGTIMIAPW